MKTYRYAFFVLMSLLLAGCELLQEPKLPSLDIEVLGPLTRSEISLSSFSSSLPEFDYQANISMGEIISGFTAGTAYSSIPALNNISTHAFEIPSKDYGSVTFEKGNLFIRFENRLPITINSVTLEVTSDNELIFTQTISNLAPASEFNSPAISMAGKKITNSLQVSLKDLSTEAKNTPGLITSENGIKVDLLIRDVSVEEIEILGNQSFLAEDESPIAFTTDEIKTISITGRINLLATNGLALETSVQVYFLTAENQAIDSMFTEVNIIESAKTNSEGRPVEPTKSTLSAFFDEAKYDVLGLTKKMKTVVRISAPKGSNKTIVNKRDVMLVQTIGDLIVRVAD